MEPTGTRKSARRWVRSRAVLSGVLVIAAIAGVQAAVSSGQDRGTATSIPANLEAGKQTFVSTCGICHRLSAAKTVGGIGPDLDKVNLAEATIVKAIQSGGASVMSKSAVAQYPTLMTAYEGSCRRSRSRMWRRSSSPPLTRSPRRP